MSDPQTEVPGPKTEVTALGSYVIRLNLTPDNALYKFTFTLAAAAAADNDDDDDDDDDSEACKRWPRKEARLSGGENFRRSLM